MQFKSTRHSRLFAIAGLILILSLVAWAASQNMQNMPGMGKKSTPQKKSAAARKGKATKKHNMANMPGMSMSGMHKHTRRKKRITRKRQSTTKHQMGNMPGMNVKPGT